MNNLRPKHGMPRRNFLWNTHLGLGGLALTDILARDLGAARTAPNPLALKQQQLPAKAKRCIFLFMEGGVSQIDTFEYKPTLEKYACKQIPVQKRTVGEIAIAGRLPVHCKEVDQPIAGLLTDLKARGLLEETLVVWASEMGRTPFDNNLTKEMPGRDHNQYGLVMWMAGGDIQPGTTFGETDEFGTRAAGEPIPLRDVHATLLQLMGLDQDHLTYLHAGRCKRLTDIGGRVITEILT